MSLKDSLLQKLETQTESWSKQIHSLRADAEKKAAKARNDQADAEIQKEFSEKIQALETQIEIARTRLSEVRSSGEDHLESLKNRIDEWLPSNTN
ncbi:MAG TPA: hypothetical protein VL091_15310 [Marinobacter sp.]|nr:hypothetical protein [Marinobacter sp.]